MKKNYSLLIILATLLTPIINLSAMPRGGDGRRDAERQKLQNVLAAKAVAQALEVTIGADADNQHDFLCVCYANGQLNDIIGGFCGQGLVVRRCETIAAFMQMVSFVTARMPKGPRLRLALMDRLIDLGIFNSGMNHSMLIGLCHRAEGVRSRCVEAAVVRFLIGLGFAPQVAAQPEPMAAQAEEPPVVTDPLAILPPTLRDFCGKPQRAFLKLVLDNSVNDVLGVLAGEQAGEALCCCICFEELGHKDNGVFSFQPNLLSNGRPNPESIVLPFACHGTGTTALHFLGHAIHRKCSLTLKLCPICRCEERS